MIGWKTGRHLRRSYVSTLPAGVPNSLTHSEPVFDTWNIGGLFCPGKQRGLVAEYALEWGGGLLEGILCILNLQALENLSTAMRMQINPSELGRSVMMLTPRWDQGRRGMVMGPIFRRVSDVKFWRWH